MSIQTFPGRFVWYQHNPGLILDSKKVPEKLRTGCPYFEIRTKHGCSVACWECRRWGKGSLVRAKQVGCGWCSGKEGRRKVVCQTSHNQIPAQIQTWGTAGNWIKPESPKSSKFPLSLSFIASVQVNKLTQLLLYEFSQLHLGKSGSREWVGS